MGFFLPFFHCIPRANLNGPFAPLVKLLRSLTLHKRPLLDWAASVSIWSWIFQILTALHALTVITFCFAIRLITQFARHLRYLQYGKQIFTLPMICLLLMDPRFCIFPMVLDYTHITIYQCNPLPSPSMCTVE